MKWNREEFNQLKLLLVALDADVDAWGLPDDLTEVFKAVPMLVARIDRLEEAARSIICSGCGDGDDDLDYLEDVLEDR